MKILLLSHVPIYPVIGGDRVRIRQTLSFLLDRHEVDVAYMAGSDDLPPLKNYEPRVGKEWRFVVSRVRKVFQAAHTIVNRYPVALNLFYHKPMQRLVNRIVGEYDIVVCASAGSALYGIRVNHCNKILDMTDSLTMNYLNAAVKSSIPKKWLWEMDACRMRKFERICGASYKAVSYISERDRDYVGLSHANTYVVPNYVNVSDGTRPLYESGRFGIVFVGKMNYEPNVRAVRFFANEVMPLLGSGYQFRIVGASPVNEVMALGRRNGVEVTGLVEDVAPFYDEASVVVAPMLSGSGVQNKILEAMGRGCCVVTTPIGAEGLETVRDGLIICTPSAIEMAACITELRQSPDRIKAKGALARKLVAQEFGYEKVRDAFYEFVGE